MAEPPTKIRKWTEGLEESIQWAVEYGRSRGVYGVLLILAAALIVLYVTPLPGWIEQHLWPESLAWLPLAWVWWAVVGGLLIAALVLAWRKKPEKGAIEPPTRRSAIKGLWAYERADAGVFRRLQREDILRKCRTAIHSASFRFGILSAESGCGKTSFLQAGLLPTLDAEEIRNAYVRFSDRDPLETVRDALTEQLDVRPSSVATPDVPALLKRAASQAGGQPVVVVFDQFEQFFVHNKRREDRQPFLDALAAWYRERPAPPVKLILSIRADFRHRLDELQEVMGYALGWQDLFVLEKFSPAEAVEVFRVLAAEEGLRFDEGFVREMVESELADREEGLVSPVDVQVLAWMIAGQRQDEDRRFDQRAYERLGGVEGLLEHYLKETLDVRETAEKRRVALKVLLSLADLDRGTRAGQLTLEEIREKLSGDVRGQDVEEAVAWLSSGNVRLVTPVRREGRDAYELAHERLIPALRKLAGNELTPPDQATRLLDRRVNEWLGNDRSARYLLPFREWRRIERQRKHLRWEPKRAQKQELLLKSKRRWQKRAAIVPILLLVLGFGYMGAQSETWQIRQVKRAFSELNRGEGGYQVAIAWAGCGAWDRAEAVAGQIEEASYKAGALREIAVAAAWAGEWKRGRQAARQLSTTTDREKAYGALVAAWIARACASDSTSSPAQ